MDTEDGDLDNDPSRLQESKSEKTIAPPVEHAAPHGIFQPYAYCFHSSNHQ